MARLSPAQRRIVVEQLSGWLRRVLEDETNDVDFHVEQGMDRAIAEDLETMEIRPNGRSTLIVHINGGARSIPAEEQGPARPEA